MRLPPQRSGPLPTSPLSHELFSPSNHYRKTKTNSQNLLGSASQRSSPTSGTFASTSIRLKCHKKYILPLKQSQTALIKRSTINWNSSTFAFTTTTATTKFPPSSKMPPPTNQNSLLNIPTPSPAVLSKKVLWKIPLLQLPPPHKPINLSSWFPTSISHQGFCTQILPSTSTTIPLSSSNSPSPIFPQTFQELQ